MLASYVTLTRTDFSFTVNNTCQFLSSPTSVHWSAVKGILRFLQSTVTTGLKFRSHNQCCSVHSRILIGRAVRMTDDQQEAMQSFFVAIWCHGVQENRLRCHDPAQKQSTSPWQMPQLSWFGFSCCSRNLEFFSHDHQVYGVIILKQPISLLILYFAQGLNI